MGRALDATTRLVRFEQSLQGIGVSSFDPKVFDELCAAYAEPTRFYHNLTHVAECLAALDQAAPLAESPHEIAIALWFHDAVYDTHRSDNEQRSADWASRFLDNSRAPRGATQRIVQMILVTRHLETPQDEVPVAADAALLVDIDLGILGQSARVFERYDDAIRREYHWLPETTYRDGRSRVLEGFLQRPRIYTTPSFFERFEAPARDNLVRTIEKLRAAP